MEVLAERGKGRRQLTMTYLELATENKYLYGQLEHCSLMMGVCLMEGNISNYNDYLIVRSGIRDKIEINLELIEDIWNTPVRPAAKRPINTNFRNESNLIKRLTAEPETTVKQLARLFHITEKVVLNIVKKYNLEVIPA